MSDEGIRFVISRPKGKRTTEVQSVLFRKGQWTVQRAKAWLKRHNMKVPAPEMPTGRGVYVRFAQRPKTDFLAKHFSTIVPGAKTAKKKSNPRKKAAAKYDHHNYRVMTDEKGTRKYFDGLNFSVNSKKSALFHDKEQARSVAQALADRLRVQTIVEAQSEKRANLVPPSQYAKVSEAIELYKQFTGHEPEHIDEIAIDPVEVAFRIGDCDEISYTAMRDGKEESYVHSFKKRARPVLASSFDGQQLLLLGGKYQFTRRGIEDG